ncbi:hypothetical protein ECG_05243 [Echinococcus granulosus]|nr:hypothetical protein ECG_05243 [Echinococcus granulosus]CDS18146.1 expressed conserved protein [Echinococcus granulosus]
MDSNGLPASPPEVDYKPSQPQSPQTDYFGWLKSTLSQSADVWSHIKRDVSEVAQTVAASDPLTAAKGTATSVYRQFSDALHTLQQEGSKAEPPPSDPVASTVDDDGDLTVPFSNLKSSFSSFVGALGKGISELTGGSFNFFGGPDPGNFGDNRDACIDVIRSDPSTYERPPSSQKDILSYSEWRSNFFDEHTCRPRPDIPVFEGDTLPTTIPATTATYPSPSQVLEASPIVRSHLLRLVDPVGGGTDSGGDSDGNLSEADFWSRYYYHVWRFDVLSLRCTRLTRIYAASAATMTLERADEVEAWPDLEVEEKIEEAKDVAMSTSDALKSTEEIELPDTLTNSLREAQSPKDPSTEYSTPASSVVMVTKEEAVEANEGDDEEDEELTQQLPLKCAAGGLRDIEEREEEEDGIQLSIEYLQEEEAKLRAELGSEEDDKSEASSDWEKWS